MAQWAKVLTAKAENGLHLQDPHDGKTEPTPSKSSSEPTCSLWQEIIPMQSYVHTTQMNKKQLLNEKINR